MSPRNRAPVTYSEAGVSIKTADRLVEHLKTINPNIGGFSGMIPLNIRGMKQPMLVASTDGVGTKLLVAIRLRRLETVGIDLVAMSVNDLIVCGAQPLLFLDYYATGKLQMKQAKAIISGIVEGCQLAGCPLVGGESAEMPGLYQGEECDLAGFAVGLLDRTRVIDGSSVKPGDVIIGLPSSGLHSNGYSLARRVLGDTPARLRRKPRILGGLTVGEVLLTPTRIYVRSIVSLLQAKHKIKAMAHITGGGLPGNVNRVLPSNADAEIWSGTWNVPPIFQLVASEGPVPPAEMHRTFNMGIGYVIISSPGPAKAILAHLKDHGEIGSIIGTVVPGAGQVRIISKPTV
jgi:phosphoribosylformylglycinamidine cyclo-ligase